METKEPAATNAISSEILQPEVVITAYKGFDANMQCLGFQYQIGKSYTHNGEVQACESGFHACENPLDVWNYYSPADSKFCEVEISGELSRPGGDSKIAAGKITIKAEIGIPEIVTAAITQAMAVCKDAKNGDIAAGDYSTQAASEYNSKQAASEYNSKQAAAGDHSMQAAGGHHSKQAASGDHSKQAASGDHSTQAASGYSSKQAASGDYSKQAASGYSSKQAASGDYSKQAASGKNSVIVAAGLGAKAKAAEGGCFALRWDDPYRPRIAVAYVGEDGIKPDVFYKLNKSGEFVEVIVS